MGAGASSIPPGRGTNGAWADPMDAVDDDGGVFANEIDEADERLDKAAVKRAVGAMHRLCRRRAHDFEAETAAIDEFFETTADADGTVSRAELRAAVRLALEEQGEEQLDEELRRRCGKVVPGDPSPLALGPGYLPSLVKRGANPESLDDHGMSALAYAAGDGQVAQMRWLCDVYNDGMGVLDIDAVCPPNDRTALWIACAAGHRAAVIYLLGKGADADIAGRGAPRYGNDVDARSGVALGPLCTPAEVARMNGQTEVAELVEKELKKRAADTGSKVVRLGRVRKLRAGMISERDFRQQILPPEETGLVAIVPETADQQGSSVNDDDAAPGSRVGDGGEEEGLLLPGMQNLSSLSLLEQEDSSSLVLRE